MKKICAPLLLFSLALNAMEAGLPSAPPLAKIVIASALINTTTRETIFSHQAYYRRNHDDTFECYDEFHLDSNDDKRKIHADNAERKIAAWREKYTVKTSAIDVDQSNYQVYCDYILNTQLAITTVNVNPDRTIIARSDAVNVNKYDAIHLDIGPEAMHVCIIETELDHLIPRDTVILMINAYQQLID